MSEQIAKVQRVGPKVRVDIQYECNGCMYHSISEEKCVEDGREYVVSFHTCNYPTVIEEFKCPQFMHGAEGLTIHHTARTPPFMCPYIKDGK